MPETNAGSFIRKTYKVFLFFILIIGFFVFYNTYLVDHSIINLRIALDKAAQAQAVEDFESIKPLLKVPILTEVTKKEVSNRTLVSMESTVNIASTAKKEEQISDIRFYLKSVIEDKEKERGAILSALDRLNAALFKAQEKLPEDKLQGRIAAILSRIDAIKDPNLLQEAYYNLGNLYIQAEDYPEAAAAFAKSVGVNPSSAVALKARFNMAWSCKSMGDYDKAVEDFESLVKEFPEMEPSVAGRFQIADSFYKKGDFEKARDEYARIAAEYPKLGNIEMALFEAGYISFYNLNDADAAAGYFAKLMETAPKSGMARHVKVDTSFNMAADFRAKGYALLEEKKYDEAIANFEKAIKIAPYDGTSYSGMGISLYFKDSMVQALDNAKKAVEYSLENNTASTNSLYVYIKVGKIDEAIKIGEAAIAARAARNAEFYHNLGCAYGLKGRVNEALIQFVRAIKLKPDFAPSYTNLGWAFWKVRRYADAITKFKEAINIDPDYLYAHFDLGVAYFQLNKPEDAYREFKEALRIDPAYKNAAIYMRQIEKNLGYVPG